MLNWTSLLGALAGVVLLFICIFFSVFAGYKEAESVFQKEAVENNYAQFNTRSGKFEWLPR